MHKVNLRLLITGSIFVVCLMVGAVGGHAGSESVRSGKARSDILHIDTLKVFGTLERGPVTFFHDKHTNALKKMGKGLYGLPLETGRRGSAQHQV